ncbi:Glycine-zipper containing OmpA-like membrane domain-containing protein [Noviherbaspirillum humi]|uniref:Glycine-zipper containing OmpA-like membrane domain-containing protein n=1 Tax=Noviherbaspirillum humi TaxID=1688639 RepID=A0A239I2N5_9BURK|nr:glycine zipper family protein [Noviherbaspirillum humi]SNS86624.1 Glycine-zipper containing OmpA-like membrane domain-containing protein [Noviherbaspirillum humi]
MKIPVSLFPFLLASLVAGCATVPDGPSIMVLPGTGKSLDQFRADDGECRQYVIAQLGGTGPSANANDSGVRSAVAGTAIGAVAGAAINGGQGAGVGAGAGLLMGSLAGTGTASQSYYGTQRRYDMAYSQCMYAKGHRIPVYERASAGGLYAPRYAPTPPAGAGVPIPPPPPGTPAPRS